MKKRHQDFVNGDFDGEAEQKYKATANRLMEEAKASDIFANAFKAVDITPDSRFKTKMNQPKKASDVIKEYEEKIKKVNLLDQEQTKEAEPYKLKIEAYNRYQEDKKLLELAYKMLKEKEEGKGDVKETKEYIEGKIKEIKDAIAAYEKKKTPTKEEIKDAKEKMEELLAPITRKFDDVTIVNFIDMSEKLVKDIEELCRDVSESDDDWFMKNYLKLYSLSWRIRGKEDHIKGRDVYSQAGTKYRQVNGIHDTRKKLDAIFKKYPVYFNMDNILKARINSIKKYGYTNMDSLVHVEDMEEVLTTVREWYRKAEKTLQMPMSVNEALELKIVANAFGDLQKMDLAALASWAEYFESPRNDNYTPEMNLFYKRCKAAFAQGSTLSVAIPHCVDLLGAEEKKRKNVHSSSGSL